MRIAAILEYDGAKFCGWQWQDGVRTVQAVVEASLAKVADAPVRVITAGRTDTGVHACAQVIHFDTRSPRSDSSWRQGANSNLPPDVAVRWVGERDTEFHARFSATGRQYRYVIFNRRVRPTHLLGHVTWEYRQLDVSKMRQAATFLQGTHDFTSFRTVHCQAKSPVRELRSLEVTQSGSLIHITADANAYLHHMVRNLAGVLIAIGAGEQPPEWAREVLEARDRALGGVTAPPDGLYLTAIEYPEAFDIPNLSPDSGLW